MWTLSLPLHKVRCKHSNLWTRGRGLSAGQTGKEDDKKRDIYLYKPKKMWFEEISGWLFLSWMDTMCECLYECRSMKQKTRAFSLQLHTYMNDVWIGVPVIGANEKVNQELSSIFLIQLGNDVLQPPLFTWRMEKEGKVRKNEMAAHDNRLCVTVDKNTLP